MPRRYRVAYLVCGILALSAAVIGPIIAIRVLASSDASRVRASDRITGLQAQITQLQSQVTQSAADLAAVRTIAEALAVQVKGLGGQPVVTPQTGSITPTTAAPQAGPSTTTSSTRPCRVSIGGVCVNL